jgi:hypothetical protein
VGIVPLVLLVLIIASVMGVKKGREESLERGNEMFLLLLLLLIYQSFEQYKLQPPQYKGEAPSTTVTQAPTLSDVELKSRYDQMIIDEKSNTKVRAVNSLIKSFGWIIVPLPIFLYFQSRLKKQPVQ